ncbi:MAG: phenylalanine--tRNA ligase subunit beta [Chloroflexota bacterium]|nr:phenylalanine--tRNA ligase subunit beta [Chloroflexota bacterium]
MKAPVSWLRQYVEVPPVDELLPRLTEIGHMLDGPVESTAHGPVVSLEVRQNRPDCLSMLGLAREIAAAFGSTVREVRTAELPDETRRSKRVAGEDPVCFLHIRGARLDGLSGTMIGDLERYGQRTLSPLVDLANYVTIELGQPLHVYAADQIDVESAASRSARTGERLQLIDGRTVELAEDDLIIADTRGPLAMAGVMGGRTSGVDSHEGDIIVEAGHFRSHVVRRTARRHGLSTEASIRSSKLLPPALVEIGLSRFLALLLEHGRAGEIELWLSGPAIIRQSDAICLSIKDIERIAGVRIQAERSVEILRSLGFAAVTLGVDETLSATPPWWRTDVEQPADLIDEIVRIQGYSHIPPAALPALASVAPAATTWDQEESVRGLLCAWGYDEVILDSFVTDTIERLEQGPETLYVENPPAGKGMLRPSLLPNMLSGARYLPFLMPERRLFEIGRTFGRVEGRPEEQRTVAWAVMSGSGAMSWHAKERRADFYTVTAEAEAVLRTLGVPAVAEPSDHVAFPFLPGRSVRLVDAQGRVVGHVGELEHEAFGLKAVQVVFGAEVFLQSPAAPDPTLSSAHRAAESFDISVLVAMDTRASAVEHAIVEATGSDLIAARLLAVYVDPSFGEQRRSLTFRVVYASSQGDARAVWEQVRGNVERRLDAIVRGSER